jgi:CIC family chloride channel protein
MNEPAKETKQPNTSTGQPRLAAPAPWRGWFPGIFRYHSGFHGQARLLALSILVGVVAGVGAIGFYLATQAIEHYALGEVVGYHPQPRPAGEPHLPGASPSTTPFRPWLLLLIPTLGGLASGVLVFTVAPEAEGHGTDSVIAAYHQRQGQIRPRVPLVKIVASSLTIGTGGSGGREGPIAQIGAGFGSLLSNLLHLRAADRRVLMAAGMGAGIAAVFRAPLAGTIFAAEVLYHSAEFESEVIIPTGIASVVSYCIFGVYSGWEPLFAIPALSFTDPAQLGPYLLLALFMAFLAMLYTRSFYGCQRLFARLPFSRHFRPALGALLTGVLGLALYYSFGDEQVLAVLSFGYSAVQGALQQDTLGASGILLAIALGKIVTTSLTIASGGSGGVFGPSMVIGGCGGGALGVVLHHFWPALVPHPASFVIVGMAGFFAAAAKTPFSTLLIVSEMTGGYALLLPALWVCTLSFILSDEQTIYSSQVEGRSSSPAHRGSYVRQILANVRVRQFLSFERPPLTLEPGDALSTALDRFAHATSAVLPVVDGEHRLLGVVDLEEIHLAAQAPDLGPLVVVVDMMRSDVRPLLPDDTLDHAMELFVENDLMALPIVDDLKRRTVLGLVRRFDIANAYVRYLHGPVVGPELQNS